MTFWSDLPNWENRSPVLHHAGTISDYRYVVIHTAEGSYEGTIAWQKNTASDNSSHFIVDYDGKIAQVNDTANRSGAQKNGNPYSIAIENAGNSGTPLTEAQLTANAHILAKAHTVHGIPLQVTNNVNTNGLGHHSMGFESGVDWGHHFCPGEIIKAQKAQIVGRAKSILAPAPITHGVGEHMFYTVTGAPAGTVDVAGVAWTNGGQYEATVFHANGRCGFGYTGTEFFSTSADAQAARLAITYPRFAVLCNGLSPDPIDVNQLANQIAAAYPPSAINEQVIIDAISSPEGHAAFVEILDSPEGQASLAEAAEYAEDH